MSTGSSFEELVPWAIALGICAVTVTGWATYAVEGDKRAVYEEKQSHQKNWSKEYREVSNSRTCDVDFDVMVTGRKYSRVPFPKKLCSFAYEIGKGGAGLEFSVRYKGHKSRVFQLGNRSTQSLGSDISIMSVRLQGAGPVPFKMTFSDPSASDSSAPTKPAPEPKRNAAEARLVADINQDYSGTRPSSVRIRDCSQDWAGVVKVDGWILTVKPEDVGGVLKAEGVTAINPRIRTLTRPGRQFGNWTRFWPKFMSKPFIGYRFCLRNVRRANAKGVYKLSLRWLEEEPVVEPTRPAQRAPVLVAPARQARPAPPVDNRPQCFGFASACDERHGRGGWR